MVTCLHSLSGYLCTSMAELGSCDRDHMDDKILNRYYQALYRKFLPNSGLKPKILGYLFVTSAKDD